MHYKLRCVKLCLSLTLILIACSCKKEKVQPTYYSKKVTVNIQNYSVHEPIAVRLTDGCWATIPLNASQTFLAVTPNENCQLIAFSEYQCPNSYNIIKADEGHQFFIPPDTWSFCVDDVVARPCVDSLTTFEFSSKRKVDTEGDEITIKILAEEFGGRPVRGEGAVQAARKIKFTIIN